MPPWETWYITPQHKGRQRRLAGWVGGCSVYTFRFSSETQGMRKKICFAALLSLLLTGTILIN